MGRKPDPQWFVTMIVPPLKAEGINGYTRSIDILPSCPPQKKHVSIRIPVGGFRRYEYWVNLPRLKIRTTTSQ